MEYPEPSGALATVFGHDAMWWYRLYISLGKQSIVSTSVYNLESLPRDLLADEHHIKIRGEKAYVATTVGENCFLGMEVSSNANEASLEKAYGVFKEEVLSLDADYQPNSVNTDACPETSVGWWATQNAWKKLFPTIAVIECFLHAFLKVRDRATKKMNDYFNTAADKIWNCYRTESKRQLAQSRGLGSDYENGQSKILWIVL